MSSGGRKSPHRGPMTTGLPDESVAARMDRRPFVDRSRCDDLLALKTQSRGRCGAISSRRVVVWTAPQPGARLQNPPTRGDDPSTATVAFDPRGEIAVR